MSSFTPPYPDTVVPSPCVSRCGIGEQGFCTGCGRLRHEIGLWSRASAEQRLEIRAAAHQRLLAAGLAGDSSP